MTEAPFLSRRERFASVGSTNDVVRGWLAQGVPEVCVAVADEQSSGRGREGRTWSAPPGRGLLLSVGFRPSWLPARQAWRLAAIVSLAMADAAEEVAGLRDRTIRLKWPNDLVVDDGHAIRKLAGVLGETSGLGSDDPRAVIGIGVNGDWPAGEFPADLADAMTSLRVVAGRPVDQAQLLDAFLDRLEPRTVALRADRFDVGGWEERQLTNGRRVRLEGADGSVTIVRAVGVDPASGALLVEDGGAPRGERAVLTGEIQHLRLEPDVPAGDAAPAEVAARARLGAPDGWGV